MLFGGAPLGRIREHRRNEGEGEAKPPDLWRWVVIDNNPTPKLGSRQSAVGSRQSGVGGGSGLRRDELESLIVEHATPFTSVRSVGVPPHPSRNLRQPVELIISLIATRVRGCGA